MCLIVVIMCTVWIIFLLPRMRHICVGASGIRAGRSGTVPLRLKGSLPGLPLADDGNRCQYYDRCSHDYLENNSFCVWVYPQEIIGDPIRVIHAVDHISLNQFMEPAACKNHDHGCHKGTGGCEERADRDPD